jgi:transcription initiation factor TFIIH subunit 1
MLKIFEKPHLGDGEPVAYLFHFNSPSDARPEANALKDILSQLLAGTRKNDPSLPKAAVPDQITADAGSQSAAMAFASTVNSASTTTRWFDDNVLKSDIELQQSLMKKDRALHQTYMDARATKPDSISDAAFNSQFWSSRTNLLRAHVIDINQKKGAYNVLSTVKPRTVDGELKLNISVEQVQLIFQQHPLVKRIYNENVPKLSEGEFWSRFFLSKLSKKLRGERVTDLDNSDLLFDKYNSADDTIPFPSKILSQAVPHIIDLEGNEENQGGFRGGNRKDVEMRPRSNVPIVKTLNSLSEKIMANVAPTDQDPAGAGSLDDEVYSELTLRDLRGDAETSRIILNVKEQSKFFSNQGSDKSEDAKIYEKQDPSEVLFEIQADLETLDEDGAGGIDLHRGIGIDDDSGSDDETRRNHVGSRAARKRAQDQILDGMKKKRPEIYGQDDDDTSPMGIPPDITQRCYITNATTTEFLSQFWNAFLSGDPDRAQELAYHVESLGKSKERIEALAEEAEKLRAQIIEQKKKDIVDYYNRTKKRIKNWHPKMVKGGKDAVLALFKPTMESLTHAQNLYHAALAAEGSRSAMET